MSPRPSRTLFTALAIVVVAACARNHPPSALTTMGPEAAKERARLDSLRYPYTKADIDFMTGMIHHHAQALVMARWAPTHGASPALQRLCERIINSQTDDIRLMQRWLRDRNQPVPEPNPEGMPMHDTSMPGMAMDSVMPMPGMLTPAQMKALDAARGEEFDRLFLTGMIQHHRGALIMVRTLFASPGAGQDEVMFKFASDVEVDQSTEIKRMQQMLIEAPPPPPPSPRNRE